MASKKITALAAATTLGGPDLLTLVQGGVNKKIPASVLQQNLDQVPSSAVVGTTTNNDAGAGKIGEVLYAEITEGAAINVPDSTNTQLASISLTPGDWEITGAVFLQPTGMTVGENAMGYASPTVSSLGTNAFWTAHIIGDGTSLTDNIGFNIPTQRVKVAAATTKVMKLGIKLELLTGTCVAFGFISARRMR